MPQADQKTNSIAHWPERLDLCAALRWTAHLNMHESVANHYSLALDDAGRQFLINPRGRHFSRLRASELLLLDASCTYYNQRSWFTMYCSWMRWIFYGFYIMISNHISEF